MKGAAGVLIVHETGPAGYGFNVIQGKTGEQFDLVTPDKNMGRAVDRRLDHARPGDEAAADGGSGLRHAQEAGGHARVQAGAARGHGVDDDPQHAPDDRLEERDGEARRVGSGVARRVRRSIPLTGIISGRAPKGSSMAPSTTRRARRRSSRSRRAFTKVSPPPQTIDSVRLGDGGGAGPARIAVLRGDAGLSAGEDRCRNQHGRHQRARPDERHDAHRLRRL